MRPALLLGMCFLCEFFPCLLWVVPLPSNSGNEGLGWDPLLKMVHNPGGDWNPGKGDNPMSTMGFSTIWYEFRMCFYFFSNDSKQI